MTDRGMRLPALPHGWRGRWIVVGTGVLVGGLAALRVLPVSRESDPSLFWQREGARVYAGMSAEDLCAPAIRAVLAQAAINDAQGLLSSRPDRIEDLRIAVGDFLATRFEATTSQECSDRMGTLGYKFIDSSEFLRRYGDLRRIVSRFELTSSDLPEVYDELWNHPELQDIRPVRICTHPDAALISVGRTTLNSEFTGVFSGGLSEDLWLGFSGATCRTWHIPPRSRREVREQAGSALAARVGIIVENSAGTRNPIIIEAYFDPSVQQWWIDRVLATNANVSRRTPRCTEY